MKKLTLFVFMPYLCMASTVGISDNPNFTPDESVPLHVDSSPNDKGAIKSAVLPKAKNKTQFPEYNPGSPTGYNENPNLTGSIIYNEEDDVIYEYDGKQWLSIYEYAVKSKEQNVAHYSIKPSRIKCFIELGIASCKDEKHNGIFDPQINEKKPLAIEFSAIGADAKDFNNIPEDVVLSDDGKELIFPKGGVYNISFRIPGYPTFGGWGNVRKPALTFITGLYIADDGANFSRYEYKSDYYSPPLTPDGLLRRTVLQTDAFNISLLPGARIKLDWYLKKFSLPNIIPTTISGVLGAREDSNNPVEFVVERINLK